MYCWIFFQKGTRWVIYMISSEFSGQFSSQYCEVTILWTWLGLSPKAHPIVYTGHFSFRSFHPTVMSFDNKCWKQIRGDKRKQRVLYILSKYIYKIKLNQPLWIKNTSHCHKIHIRKVWFINNWMIFVVITFHLIQNVQSLAYNKTFYLRSDSFGMADPV